MTFVLISISFVIQPRRHMPLAHVVLFCTRFAENILKKEFDRLKILLSRPTAIMKVTQKKHNYRSFS